MKMKRLVLVVMSCFVFIISGNAVTYNSDCKNAKQENTMTQTYYILPNGDKYLFEFVGNDVPDAETVQKVYNGKSKDIRVKKVVLKKDAENIGTAEGLAKNFGRGFTFSLSRNAENNSRALDRWNEDNPVKSSIADIAGSIPSMFLPGGLIGVGAKVLSKAKMFVKLAKVAAKLKIANKLKTAANVFSKPTVKAATSGGAYSGFRSFIDRARTQTQTT
jgi:hypothetical protein